MTRSLPPWFTELVHAAAATDGQPPFSDQSLVDLATGARTLTGMNATDGAGTGGATGADATGVDATDGVELIAAAVHSQTELELVVHPDHRRQGHGARLVDRVLGENPTISLAWAHGDHPGSRILAARFGFEPVRTLLQLRTPLREMQEISALSAGGVSDGATPAPDLLHFSVGKGHITATRAFRPGVDDEAWLDLNARAFAEHPEQGALTQRDLDARKAEAWFDADSFLLLFDGDELVGSNWLKIDPDQPDLGEIYAISVAPEHQGKGHSRRLMDAGLARLRERGATTASLYVEADNHPALALYERYGFARHTIDVQYSRA